MRPDGGYPLLLLLQEEISATLTVPFG